MKHWKGRWLITVSAIHTLEALLVFGQVFESILREGLFNTVSTDPATGVAVWFLLFGAMLFLFGLSIPPLEKSGAVPIPRPIGWSLLGTIALGVILMPESGFWLGLPPAIAMLRRSGG